MRILVDILHPVHAHKFNNVASELKRRGHEILVLSRDKEFAPRILSHYGLSHICISKASKDAGLLFELLTRTCRAYLIARRFKPDIIVGMMGSSISVIGKLMGVKSILLEDTENVPIHRISLPLADYICTPQTFKQDFGKKHARFNGYFDLCYLSQKYFSPNTNVLSKLGVSENDSFYLVRLSAWNAHHDLGLSGFNLSDIRRIICILQKRGKVFVSSEKPADSSLKPYLLPTSPEEFIYVVYYAALFVGDNQTTASEAGMLGVPAIRCNPLVGTMHSAGRFEELEQAGLTISIRDKETFFKKLTELCSNPHLKREWTTKRDNFLSKKDDITLWLANFIENRMKS